MECSEAVLDGMALSSWLEAERRLSPEGMEPLRMVRHAADALCGGAAEAWELAENVEHLEVREVGNIEAYFARETLIEAAREGLYESPDPGPTP